MPIAGKPQVYTTEDRFAKILEILSHIRNPADANFLRSFILELCTRYIDKNNELTKYTPASISQMNKFETEYIERIVRELGLNS